MVEVAHHNHSIAPNFQIQRKRWDRFTFYIFSPLFAHAKAGVAAMDLLCKWRQHLPAKTQFCHAVCNIIVQAVEIKIHAVFWRVPIKCRMFFF